MEIGPGMAIVELIVGVARFVNIAACNLGGHKAEMVNNIFNRNKEIK